MKRVAVLGANSYIARNLIFVLEQKYPDIEILLYDCSDTQVDNRQNYCKINILDEKSLANIDFSCDVIFMFIGKTGSANGFDEYNTFIDINEKALLNVLNEYRRQASNAKIIFPSTRLVYKGNTGPLKEDAEKEFKTIYAINKYACEQYLKQYNNVYGVQYCIFRICIPYGTLIPNATSYGTAEFMIKKASNGVNISLYGDGSLRRTLTYIGDLCYALIEGAFSDNCKNDVFNIGGEDYSLKEMAELIAKKHNVGVDYVGWPEIALGIESGDTVFDDDKLQRVCDIKYEMTFEKWCNK